MLDIKLRLQLQLQQLQMLDDKYQGSASRSPSPTCVDDSVVAHCAQHSSPRLTQAGAQGGDQETTDSLPRPTFQNAAAIISLDWRSLEQSGLRPVPLPEEYYAQDLHSADNMMEKRIVRQFQLLHVKQARAWSQERHADAIDALARAKAPDQLRLSRRHYRPQQSECVTSQSQASAAITASSATKPALAATMANGGRGYFKALAKILKARHESNSPASS